MFEFEWRATYSLRAKHILAPCAKMSLTLNGPILDVLQFKPPHYLQACTEYLPTMESVFVCKPTNFQPKFVLNWRINSKSSKENFWTHIYICRLLGMYSMEREGQTVFFEKITKWIQVEYFSMHIVWRFLTPSTSQGHPGPLARENWVMILKKLRIVQMIRSQIQAPQTLKMWLKCLMTVIYGWLPIHM